MTLGQPLLCAIALALVAVGCGTDEDQATATSGPSTSEVHETAHTIPAPGPSTSELVVASPSLDIPLLGPGGRGVVSWGRISDGAIVAVVRNMTNEAMPDAAVKATRRGGEEPVTAAGAVLPSVLHPGEWGMALVVLDRQDPERLDFEITAADHPRLSLRIESAERTKEGLAGTVGNPTPERVVDVVVDGVCFEGSRPTMSARLRPIGLLEPGASASFSAPIRGRPCADWAVVGSAASAE